LKGDAVGAAFSANLLNVFLGMLAVASVWLAGREFGRGSGIIAGLIAASCPFVTYLSGVAYVENGMLVFAALSVAALLRAGRPSDGRIATWVLLAGLMSGLACGCKYTAIPAVLVPLALAVAWSALTRRPRRPVLPCVFVFAAMATFGPWLVKNAVMTGNPVFPLARSVFHERAGIWNDDGAARWHEGHLPAPEDRPWLRRLSRLWQEVLGSSLFGPALVLAIAAGAVGALRRSSRSTEPAPRDDRKPPTPLPVETAPMHAQRSSAAGMDPCWLMLIVGVVVWTGWTHLAGRFAVTLIVPAAVMLGRSWSKLGRPAFKAIGMLILIGVLAMNTYTTRTLFGSGSASFLQLGVFGHTDVMTGGLWPQQQHIPKLNALLAKGEKVLMVADARRFYLDRGADYCVVFSRNPFAEAAATLSPEDLIEWLRARQYKWVYVDWTEMHRLRTTRYGFWQSVDKELFIRLTTVGLRPVEDFEIPGVGTRYATLFEVPPGGRTTGPR
ncbi:MAG TPA: glycosyltransferase family 39 protein, partial [Phycisphaerae bacterium]|nr:glycosyltransferase family 39 protein [Phycisphaerae bacterium]